MAGLVASNKLLTYVIEPSLHASTHLREPSGATLWVSSFSTTLAVWLLCPFHF